jgi:adenylosuccinate lyase
MMTIFSARERASTWRQLWVWLAEAEKELGLPIPDEALDQMRANVVVSDKAFSVARDYEAKFRVCSSSLPHYPGKAECTDAAHSMMSWLTFTPTARYEDEFIWETSLIQ